MRRLLVALMIGVAVALTACGPSASLTSNELKAVKAVEANVTAYVNITKYTAPVVIGVIAKDTDGNKVTFVDVKFTNPDTGKLGDFVIMIIENQQGKLLYADVLLPSGVVNVP